VLVGSIMGADWGTKLVFHARSVQFTFISIRRNL
jgi:hypothetical protein